LSAGAPARLAALLTDFGTDDVYVGVMKAVLLGICPAARIVDLTHAIPPQDVRLGALALADAVPYLPAGAVVVAVVDPGVGSERAALAARAGGRYFVGPDNGLLSWCLDADAAVVRLAEPRYRLSPLSDTFHGRDVFAPAAAHLLNGLPLDRLGPPAGSWRGLERPAPTRRPDGGLDAHVIAVDRFGNLILDLGRADLPARPAFEVAGQRTIGLVRSYAGAGGCLAALVGSFGRVELAWPNGSAAARLGVGVGATVVVREAGADQ
jgi:S-adenosyl-L-methionine hydrolase (adenosine-forming)